MRPGADPVTAQTTDRHYSEMGKASVRSRRVADVERRIKQLVDSAPPLTPQQRDRLAVLLRAPSQGTS